MVVLVTGCGTQATAPTATPTVTVAPSAPETSAAAQPSPTATVTVTTAPSASASSSAAPSSDEGDPNTPADQCDDASIGVTVAIADGGGGAGSEYYNVLFTNTGGSSCVLRGTPGVSVVGNGNGTQIGPAADRVETGVKSLRLAVGETVAAPLKIVNIGSGGGPLDGCRVVHGDGYRVYPPHSRKAIFVKDADAVACSSGPVFMTVSPVTRLTD